MTATEVIQRNGVRERIIRDWSEDDKISLALAQRAKHHGFHVTEREAELMRRYERERAEDSQRRLAECTGRNCEVQHPDRPHDGGGADASAPVTVATERNNT